MFLLWDVGKGTVEGEDEATLNFVGSRPTAVQGCSSARPGLDVVIHLPCRAGSLGRGHRAGRDRQG
jgi:hypothetical protein